MNKTSDKSYIKKIELLLKFYSGGTTGYKWMGGLWSDETINSLSYEELLAQIRGASHDKRRLLEKHQWNEDHGYYNDPIDSLMVSINSYYPGSKGIEIREQLVNWIKLSDKFILFSQLQILEIDSIASINVWSRLIAYYSHQEPRIETFTLKIMLKNGKGASCYANKENMNTLIELNLLDSENLLKYYNMINKQ